MIPLIIMLCVFLCVHAFTKDNDRNDIINGSRIGMMHKYEDKLSRNRTMAIFGLVLEVAGIVGLGDNILLGILLICAAPFVFIPNLGHISKNTRKRDEYRSMTDETFEELRRDAKEDSEKRKAARHVSLCARFLEYVDIVF